MGSPYLKSNEAILLSTNNVTVDIVQAEMILTNERLMLIDTGSTELQPQDIPFGAIETVIIDESPASDPVLSLSLSTGPGISQTLSIVFPQLPKMHRVAERDEWAARLKELSLTALSGGERMPVVISPPWVPGPAPEETGGAAPGAGAESGFRNPPLTPRKSQKSAASQNRTATAAVVIIIIIALAAVVFLYAPSLLSPATAQPSTPVPTTTATPAPSPATTATPAVPETTETPAVAATTRPVVAETPAAEPEIVIPGTGVWVLVKYEGSFSGSAGAPGRFRVVNGTGSHIYQLPVKGEIVTATIQKQDNTGRKLTVELYDAGVLVKSVSVSAPSGTVLLSADLRTI